MVRQYGLVQGPGRHLRGPDGKLVSDHAYWLFFLATEAFFLLLLTGPSNPFLEAVPPLAEGRGLNPLLRNPGMSKDLYLFAANVAVWVGLGAYVAFLAGAQKRLEKRIKRLEVRSDDAC